MAPTWFLLLLVAPAIALPRVRIPGTQRWFSSSTGSAPAMAATAVVPAPAMVATAAPSADVAAVQPSDHSLLTSVGWGALFLSSRMFGAPPLPATRNSGAARPPELSAPDNGAARASALPPINILCMDGGGILGRNHMVIVEEMEAATGVPASRSFDLVAGTSIGGCGALFLGKYGANATAMARAAMHELQHRCFADRSLRRLLREGHYCADGRKRFILDLCGDADCASREGPPAFAIAARRCAHSRGSLRPYLFRSYAAPEAAGVADGTSVAKLWEAVAATSAAPFMFPDARIGSSDVVGAGALLGNSAAPTRRWRLRQGWRAGAVRSGAEDTAAGGTVDAGALLSNNAAPTRRWRLRQGWLAGAARGGVEDTAAGGTVDAGALLSNSAAPTRRWRLRQGWLAGAVRGGALSNSAAPTRRWRLRRGWRAGAEDTARGGAEGTAGGGTEAESFESRELDAGAGAVVRLIDGGVVANDPTLLAIAEACALFPGRPIGTVVSLCSGVPTGDLRARDSQARHVRRTRAAVRGAAPEASYYRVVPRLPFPVSPIETDEETLASMEEATRRGFVASARGRQLLQALQRRHRAEDVAVGAASRDRVAITQHL